MQPREDQDADNNQQNSESALPPEPTLERCIDWDIANWDGEYISWRFQEMADEFNATGQEMDALESMRIRAYRDMNSCRRILDEEGNVEVEREEGALSVEPAEKDVAIKMKELKDMADQEPIQPERA
ncbi:unnamed protein product [Sphagnum balticum]